MIGKKWMLALSCAALLAAPAAGFAFGHTTVVADPRLGGSVPYIDGLRETYLQNNVNGILRSRAEALQKKAGEGARLSYEITLNRPSLVSFVLKAEGQRTVYDGVTIDTELAASLMKRTCSTQKVQTMSGSLTASIMSLGKRASWQKVRMEAPLRT